MVRIIPTPLFTIYMAEYWKIQKPAMEGFIHGKILGMIPNHV